MYTTAECRAYAEEKLKMGNTGRFDLEGSDHGNAQLQNLSIWFSSLISGKSAASIFSCLVYAPRSSSWTALMRKPSGTSLRA